MSKISILLQVFKYLFDWPQVDTFADTENDSELRIGAYLAIMNCPTESTIETVKTVLISEPVNQGDVSIISFGQTLLLLKLVSFLLKDLQSIKFITRWNDMTQINLSNIIFKYRISLDLFVFKAKVFRLN